jgi:hypothetical protein
MRLVKRVLLFVLAMTLSLGVAACGGTGDDDDDDEVDPDGTHHQYVLNELLMPTSATMANAYGLNLDGDEQGRPDNALGQILSTLASSADFDLQGTVDDQIVQGEIIILSNMQATSLTTASGVGVWVFLGNNPVPDPCLNEEDEVCGQHLDGEGSFGIDPASPEDALIVGQLVAGKYNGGPGTVTIEISLVEGEDSSIVINLIGARMEIGQVTEGAMTNGKLGGAVTEDDLDDNIMPELHTILIDNIDADCTGEPVGETCPNPPDCAPCGCEEGSTGRTLLDLFDEYTEPGDDTPDCVVEFQELLDNSLISSLLAPDVDLLDCRDASNPPHDCDFDPRKDEIKDSLSLGVAFNAVSGSFTLPASITGGGS